MKADLHYHGAIGFEPYWLRAQGYKGQNLLKEIADSCFKNQIDFCSITSEKEKIPKGSIYDRLGYLTNFIKSLPKEYKADKLGENAIVVEKEGKIIYLLNSQTVLMLEKGRIIEHLVVGSNQVPNFMKQRDAIEFGKDNGLIQIAEHPLCIVHGGMGRRLLEKRIEDYTAVEGHNSQMTWPYALSVVPLIGSFTKMVNKKAQKIAEKHNKPWIADSDAHWIKDAGLSCIEFDREIEGKGDETILKGLKEMIIFKEFKNICNYESYADWIKWVGKLIIGTKFNYNENAN